MQILQAHYYGETKNGKNYKAGPSLPSPCSLTEEIMSPAQIAVATSWTREMLVEMR